MSESKFVMAKKLSHVQKALMGKEVNLQNFDELLSLIFKECNAENLTFWFNFHEDYCVLNLRDIEHDNYELNIRHAYVGVPMTDESIIENKLHLLQNTFLLTKNSVVGYQPPTEVAVAEEETSSFDEFIFTSDEPIPPHVSKAIDVISRKGIPVSKESIKNHIPWDNISTEQRVKCTEYLNKMGASK